MIDSTIDRRLLNKSSCGLMRGEQSLNFSSHARVIAACGCEERRAFVHGALERAVEQLLHPRPLMFDHRCNSAYNHAFASVHSRPTVAGEICITSAVSSIVNPPKKRSSTTRLC